MVTTVNVLETTADYEAALKRIERLIAEDQEGSDAELMALVALVERYEEEKFPIEEPDPVDAIKFRMAELKMDEADVAKEAGIVRSHVVEFLNGERALSTKAMRKISEVLGIPKHVLI